MPDQGIIAASILSGAEPWQVAQKGAQMRGRQRSKRALFRALLAADLAGDPVSGADLLQDLLVLRAARHADGAARVEAAAGGRLDGAGHVALEEDALAPDRGIGDGHRGEERLRVGMLRVVVEL